MSRAHRSILHVRPLGTLAIAAALAGLLAAAPASASGTADRKSHRAPQAASAVDVPKKSAQAMPGPRRPGWVESLIGRVKPRPPGHTCRG